MLLVRGLSRDRDKSGAWISTSLVGPMMFCPTFCFPRMKSENRTKRVSLHLIAIALHHLIWNCSDDDVPEPLELEPEPLELPEPLGLQEPEPLEPLELRPSPEPWPGKSASEVWVSRRHGLAASLPGR